MVFTPCCFGAAITTVAQRARKVSVQIDMASHLVVLTRFAAVFVVRKWRGNGRGRGQGCSGASVSWMGSGGACRLKKVANGLLNGEGVCRQGVKGMLYAD